MRPPSAAAPRRRSRSAAAAGRGTSPVRRRVGGSSRSSRSVVTRAAPAPASAANVSSTCHDSSWNSIARGRSRGHAARSAASRASSRRDALGHPEQDRPEAVAELPERRRQPRDALGRIHPDRPPGAAPLGLDREPEVVRRRGEPAVDRGGRRGPVEGVVQLDRAEARGVVAEQIRGPEPGRIEARRPGGVGEAARAGPEPSRGRRHATGRRHGPVRPWRAGIPRGRSASPGPAARRPCRGRIRGRRGPPARAGRGRIGGCRRDGSRRPPADGRDRRR